VSALAQQLGVDWHTCWDAVEVEPRSSTKSAAASSKTLWADAGYSATVWNISPTASKPK
jgi:hypothetical protein